jgi:hypothetical protein
VQRIRSNVSKGTGWSINRALFFITLVFIKVLYSKLYFTFQFGGDMKIVGIVLLLAGFFFVLYSQFSEPTSSSSSVNWTLWIGLLVFVTGGVSYFRARNEE